MPNANPRPLPAMTTVFPAKRASAIELILGEAGSVQIAVRYPTAIDPEILPRYVARPVAREKERGVRDLPDLCQPPEWDTVGVLIGACVALGDGRGHHLGARHPGRDTVEPDVVLSPLRGQHLGQGDHTSLRRVVRRTHRPATHAPIEAMFTTLPLRRSIITRATACVHRNTPVSITSIWRRQSASGISSDLWRRAIPALFTSTSIRPRRAITFSTSPAQDLLTVTSSGTNSASYPSASSCPAAFCPCSSTSSPITTRAPARQKALAMPNPIPRPAPVTTAMRSLSSVIPSLWPSLDGVAHAAPSLSPKLRIHGMIMNTCSTRHTPDPGALWREGDLHDRGDAREGAQARKGAMEDTMRVDIGQFSDLPLRFPRQCCPRSLPRCERNDT